MAGNTCKWCGRPSIRKYCYRHIQLGRVLDDIDDNIRKIDTILSERPSKDLRTVRANLVASRVAVTDELERT